MGDGTTILDCEARTTKINNYSHFFNVENSEETLSATHSASNKAEVSCIVTLVKALLATGTVDPSDIMIVVGYREQLYLLRSVAKTGRWDYQQICDAVGLRTVHASQGREKRIVITGLSQTINGLHWSFMV